MCFSCGDNSTQLFIHLHSTVDELRAKIRTECNANSANMLKMLKETYESYIIVWKLMDLKYQTSNLYGV
jgi:hypothetical protein